MNDTYIETMNIMKKYKIKADKSLGQNFLIDSEVLEKIVNSSEINEKDLVIEIGPGLGTLTNELLEKAGKVIAVELDKRMIKILKDRFIQYSNFELINDDILKVNLKDIIRNNQYESVKIVANLPYYITTPIIMKLLEEKLPIKSITVMVQKEVADRIISIPGDKECGAITYSVFYYSTGNKIIDVPKDSFIPAPEVNSCVIKLNIRREPPVKVNDEQKFFKLIKVAFMQRRKVFANAVANSGFASKENILHILQELKIDEKIRGEKITIEQFAKIANMI